jgi:hypothetical protein
MIEFIYFILCDVGFEVEFPIAMKTDNVGAIFITQNSLTGVRSQHFDSGFHFVRENVKDGTGKVELKIPVKMHLTYSLRMSVKKAMIGIH